VKPWTSTGIIFLGGGKYFKGAKFEIHGTGPKEGAENINRTAKSVNILTCSNLFRIVLIVS